eukprot:m51a1_g13092 hypothetical protein (351) ;mRNA; r:189-1764
MATLVCVSWMLASTRGATCRDQVLGALKDLTLRSRLRSAAAGLLTAHEAYLESKEFANKAPTTTFLRAVSQTLTRVCSVNERRLGADACVQMSCGFGGTRLPDIALDDYMERLAQYTMAPAGQFATALVLLDRALSSSTALVLSQRTVHRLYAVCLVAAIKFCEDATYSNKYFAEVAGVSTEEFNGLEMTLLGLLAFDACVSVEEMRDYAEPLLVLAAQKPPVPPRPDAGTRPSQSNPGQQQQQQQQRQHRRPSAAIRPHWDVEDMDGSEPSSSSSDEEAEVVREKVKAFIVTVSPGVKAKVIASTSPAIAGVLSPGRFSGTSAQGAGRWWKEQQLPWRQPRGVRPPVAC